MLSISLELNRSIPFPLQEPYRQAVLSYLSKWSDGSRIDLRADVDSCLSRQELLALLPTVELELIEGQEEPALLSATLLYRYLPHGLRFSCDLLSRWLVPGCRLSIVHQVSFDFRLPELSEESYIFAHLSLALPSGTTRKQMEKGLSQMELQLRLGLSSRLMASHLLEIKGLSGDDKIVLLQEQINTVRSRFPFFFSAQIFSEMQYFLASANRKFLAMRSLRHLARLICLQHLFRKEFLRNTPLEKVTLSHQMKLKLFRARVERMQSGSKGSVPVLGILAAIAGLRPHELFREAHLLRTLNSHFFAVEPIPGSLCIDQRDEVLFLYIEVIKKDQSAITPQELAHLRLWLPGQLERSIEELTSPLFMPKNEEEIMRYILQLNQQVRYLQDPPQLVITLDEQRYDKLIFTIIIVRITIPGKPSIQELFEQHNPGVTYHHDRCKMMGILRKKYTKEATVFQLHLSTEGIRRQDGSIDMVRARQQISEMLFKALGDFRDFNGGLICKELELVVALHQLLKKQIDCSPYLIDNFYYSFQPATIRPLFEAEVLAQLFCKVWSLAEELSLKQEETRELLLYHYREQFSFFVAPVPSDFSLALLEEVDLALFSSNQLFIYTSLWCKGCLFFAAVLRHQEAKAGPELARQLSMMLSAQWDGQAEECIEETF